MYLYSYDVEGFEDGLRWESLPYEVLERIFGNLEVRDGVSCLQVCKQWHRLSGDQPLWKDWMKKETKVIMFTSDLPMYDVEKDGVTYSLGNQNVDILALKRNGSGLESFDVERIRELVGKGVIRSRDGMVYLSRLIGKKRRVITELVHQDWEMERKIVSSLNGHGLEALMGSSLVMFLLFVVHWMTREWDVYLLILGFALQLCQNHFLHLNHDMVQFGVSKLQFGILGFMTFVKMEWIGEHWLVLLWIVFIVTIWAFTGGIEMERERIVRPYLLVAGVVVVDGLMWIGYLIAWLWFESENVTLRCSLLACAVILELYINWKLQGRPSGFWWKMALAGTWIVTFVMMGMETVANSVFLVPFGMWFKFNADMWDRRMGQFKKK